MGLRGAAGGGGGDEAHGILEGISSLHSWIKTQTMIRPHPSMGRRGKLGGYDEVSECEGGVGAAAAVVLQCGQFGKARIFSKLKWSSS